MFSRILFSMFAAASIAAAAPALADEHTVASAAPAKDGACDVQRCCGGMRMERHGKGTSHGAMEHEKATAPSAHERRKPAAEEDPFVRNQSWGG